MDEQNKLPEEENTELDAKKEKKSTFVVTLIFVYFVLAFMVTSVLTDKFPVTKGQVSIIYLPMFFIFIKWQLERLREPNNGHSRAGNYVAIALCIFIIIGTVCITFGTWMGLLG